MTTLDERIIEAAIATNEMFSIHLGRRLGLYVALTNGRTPGELADEAGIDLRYAREWLEQQAVAGFVAVDDVEAAWDQRRYSLTDEQRALLVDADDPSHVSPLADMVAGAGMVLDQVAAAYRDGSGVPYQRYGTAFRDGQGGINRPAFTHDLVDSWLGAVPDVVATLRAGGRVADLGCGTGFSTIALAKAFPDAHIVGIDSDTASIVDARRHAAEAGVQVDFLCLDAGELASEGPFDLVTIFETLHDLARPIEVLRHVRKSLAGTGVVLIADEKVAERFTAPGDELERMMYGWSVVHCLPASLAEEGSAAIGTVIRPGLIETMAYDAGFDRFEISDIDAGFFNLYTLS